MLLMSFSFPAQSIISDLFRLLSPAQRNHRRRKLIDALTLIILCVLETMPDLYNLFNSSFSLSHCPNLFSVSDPCSSTESLYPKPVEPETVDEQNVWSWDQRLRFPVVHNGGICSGKNGLKIKVNVLKRDQKRLVQGALERTRKVTVGKSLEDYVTVWMEKKVKLGVSETECQLPFLVGAPRMIDCHVCHKFICSGERALCSVRGCQEVYHLKCAKERLGLSTSRNFKCPQHACFICKQKGYWRCVRCTIASHHKCAPWPDDVIYITNQPGRAVCWRHPTDWRLEKKEIFCRLPLPYIEEDFQIDTTWKNMMENKMEPTPYVHIRRNVYLVKKKRDGVDVGIGCTNCVATVCSEDCECRVQCVSCSKACRCSDMCSNRPFRKDKKVKIVKTECCGWGVEAAESINKGDFVIEYIGEVIDDALCEKRLWDMKYRGDQNFYMCEIRKDFTIDATFKGNASRFLNHSCDPNCKLEKWQVEGETRVGVFAARAIKVGEPLTYDYRFVQFGPEVKCCCRAPNCQGYLGIKRKIDKVKICWGSKRRRLAKTHLQNLRE